MQWRSRRRKHEAQGGARIGSWQRLMPFLVQPRRWNKMSTTTQLIGQRQGLQYLGRFQYPTTPNKKRWLWHGTASKRKGMDFSARDPCAEWLKHDTEFTDISDPIIWSPPNRLFIKMLYQAMGLSVYKCIYWCTALHSHFWYNYHCIQQIWLKVCTVLIGECLFVLYISILWTAII